MVGKQKKQGQSVILWISISLALSFAAHGLGLIADRYAGDWSWSHTPFHSFVETSGACIGLAVAGLLLLMHRAGRGTNFNVPLAFGLIAMSLLDACHALVQVGESFVWLHTIATFAGGVLFAQTCLPRRFGRQSVRLAATVCLLMFVVGGSTFVVPNWVPTMVEEEEFTFSAKALNIGGGVLMICAAIRLVMSYFSQSNRDDLLFAVHCLLFGGAAIMFEKSQLWDFSWWWWHLLRLMAYSVALGFAIQSLLDIQSKLLNRKESLAFAYTQQFKRASEISRRFEALESAIDNHAICTITDKHGKILDVNEGFCAISGYKPSEIIGKPYRVLKSGHHSKSFWKKMWRTLKAGNIWKGEICNRAKDGSDYWTASTIIPVFDEDGNIEKYISLRFDITKQKMAEQKVEKAMSELAEHMAHAKIMANQAENANLSKSEFLANMSHEIRTPMTAILGYTEILMNEEGLEKAPAHRVNALKTIQRNGEHLLSIINDILDLSKIEAGKMEVESVELSPIELVQDVVSLMKARAEGKNVDLRAVWKGTIPLRIHSDPVRLRQCLINFVGNAIKFTEIGSVTIEVGLQATDQAQSLIVFDVVDTGIGMTEEQSAKLFQPFSQADTSTTRKFGGSGLGLVITKRLAELMGGEVSLQSEFCVGSTFSISVATGSLEGVPLVDPNSAEAEAVTALEQSKLNQSSQNELKLDGCRILLAEDGPDNQRLIAFVLKKAGAQVTVVENGRLAVERFTKDSTVDGELLEPDPFDVVLMDMQMPEMDGYTASSVLKSKGCKVPIIALTAHAMASDREKCIKAGCDDFATKPIDRSQLVSLIAGYNSPQPVHD